MLQGDDGFRLTMVAMAIAYVPSMYTCTQLSEPEAL